MHAVYVVAHWLVADHAQWQDGVVNTIVAQLGLAPGEAALAPRRSQIVAVTAAPAEVEASALLARQHGAAALLTRLLRVRVVLVCEGEVMAAKIEQLKLRGRCHAARPKGIATLHSVEDIAKSDVRAATQIEALDPVVGHCW